MVGQSLAELKGRLAQVGKSLPTQRMHYRPVAPGVRPSVILLLKPVEGSEDPTTPVGYTDCFGCDELCYVSIEASDGVVSGDYAPVCPDCGTAWLKELKKKHVK